MIRRPRTIARHIVARHAFCFSFLLAAGAAFPADEDDPIDRGALSDADSRHLEQLSGFVVDRTVTNFGAQFFRFFSTAWRDQQISSRVHVTVVEKPSARFGSQIQIEHDNRPIARVFLYAGRSAAIAPLAAESARYVASRLSGDALTGMLFSDPDLGPDEYK